MRFLSALKNDMRYQLKYGFYVLYGCISVFYTLVIVLLPMEYKSRVAAFIILTDPAMLGVFFMGGIWLLEKGEGLHGYWMISPLRPGEYFLSKTLSLALISVVSSLVIVAAGMGGGARLLPMAFSVGLGAMVFNAIGLLVASYARSVNHYMMIVILPMLCLMFPPLLDAAGLGHPLLRVMPGTALWHLIAASVSGVGGVNGGTYGSGGMYVVLFLWLILFLYLGSRRISTAFGEERGRSV